MIAGFTTFIGLQCDILCDGIINMGKDRENELRVEEFIEHHKLILRFASTAGKVFSEIYFLHFISSTSTLCMTLFLLTLVDVNTSEFYYLVVYQSSVFSLLLVPCWFSSEMQRKSENLPNAIYSSPWIDASISLKKDIAYFICKTQEPIKFKALGVFLISVDTFMAVVRSSFSYYAVLNNLNVKGE
uniref:Odorant receptor OR33 n=1 Tax=Colaphellus bowringi TaxID=561076 RepID=A0A0S3J3H7_9CUCU|nr:odorant receptor OR33 [Colaphellus bowringi]